MFEDPIDVDNDFRTSLTGEDDLGKVIRAHIYIERAVINLIDLHIHDPKHLKGTNFGYIRRIQLATALGVIRPDLLPPLRKLGKMRNDFAHNPVEKISRKAESDFLSTFSKRDRDAMRIAYARNREETGRTDIPADPDELKTPARFVLAAVVLYASLEHGRIVLSESPPGHVLA